MIEVRNKRTQKKEVMSLEDAEKLLKGRMDRIGLLRVGNLVIKGFEFRHI